MSIARVHAFEQGISLLGKNLWLEYYLRNLDELLYRTSGESTLSLCLEIDDRLWALGVGGSVTRPGFDCKLASTITERAICQTPDVWADDFIMNEIYLIIRDGPRNELRSAYFNEQRTWLKMRDGCRGDVACIKTIYDLRIAILIDQLNL